MKQPHSFIDDYGNGYWRCHYTKQLLFCEQVQWQGAVMPQADWAHAVGGDGWKELWRHDRACFADMDQNCNACAHLVERVKLPRAEQIGGFGCGRCDNPDRVPTPYKERDGCIVFAPQDWMGMPCFKNRYEADLMREKTEPKSAAERKRDERARKAEQGLFEVRYGNDTNKKREPVAYRRKTYSHEAEREIYEYVDCEVAPNSEQYGWEPLYR